VSPPTSTRQLRAILFIADFLFARFQAGVAHLSMPTVCT